MGNFAENLNLGNRFRPPLLVLRDRVVVEFWIAFKIALNISFVSGLQLGLLI